MRKLSLLILTIVTFISLNVDFTQANNLKEDLAEYTTFDNMRDDLKLQKAKAQIHLLKQVLEEFGAETPEEAAEFWAKGEEERNGIFQYVVACDELKNRIQQELGDMEDNLWVIGTSSPWVKSYKIMPKKEMDKNTYEIKIIYYWTTSTGEITPSEVNLTVAKQKVFWCVKDVKP